VPVLRGGDGHTDTPKTHQRGVPERNGATATAPPALTFGREKAAAEIGAGAGCGEGNRE